MPRDGEQDGENAPLSAEPDWLAGIARAPSREPAVEPRVPFTLAHFRVEDLIGEGGMGRVYRAEDTSLQREVALKLLPAGFTTDKARRRRFLREARTAAGLMHPNIATVFEAGEAEGRVFLAMELVRGRLVRDMLRDGALPVPRAVAVARDIAAALAEAHRARIVHRDLKPENVMITAGDTVKLLDFGVARRWDDAPPSSRPSGPALTDEGMLLGTPEYMSPEQTRGQPVDGRSDVFSLGVVLYEMLTGTSPFRRATRIDTFAAIVRDAPEPLRPLAPGVPEAVAELVDACLRKPPGDRPTDGAAVHRVLVEAVESMALPGNRRRLAPRPASRPAWSRTSSSLSLTTLVAVVVAIGLASVGVMASRSSAPAATSVVARPAAASRAVAAAELVERRV
ncbi:MAG TPA: serine/threonine-protein kinase, partial [Polyangiaceae bacterium]|nr:serine/threonine-protein kinase [Polyangiaceae bacterium]